MGFFPTCKFPFRFTETLEVDNFPLPQELDHIADIRIVRYPQNVVVYGPRLLFGGEVFRQIRDRVAADSDSVCAKGDAGCIRRIHTSAMVHKVLPKRAVFDLFITGIANQLPY